MLDNLDIYFVFRVIKGIYLMVNWVKDGVVILVVFESFCLLVIVIKYFIECF